MRNIWKSKRATGARKLILSPFRTSAGQPTSSAFDPERDSLPVELILLIFDFAYPPHDAPLSRPLPASHVQGLLTFSLLSRTWYSWAQDRLLYYPSLCLVPPVVSFVKTVKGNPGLAERLKRLELDGRKYGARVKVTGMLEKMWEACKNVESVVIKDADDVSLRHFTGCQGLLTLVLLDSFITPSSSIGTLRPNLVLPSLLHLSLLNLTFDKTSHLPFFRAANLPRLIRLALADCSIGHEGLNGYRTKALAFSLPHSPLPSLLPQLSTLTIGTTPKDSMIPPMDLSGCLRLKELTIGPWAGGRRLLAALTHSLEVLRVEWPAPFGPETESVRALRDDLMGLLELGKMEAVLNLRVLVVPCKWRDEEGLRGVCERKGFQFRVDEGGEDLLTKAGGVKPMEG